MTAERIIGDELHRHPGGRGSPGPEIATLPIDAPDWKRSSGEAGALAFHDPDGVSAGRLLRVPTICAGLVERGKILAGVPVVETQRFGEDGDGSPFRSRIIVLPSASPIGVTRIDRRTRWAPTTRQRGTPGHSRGHLGPVDVQSRGRIHPCRRPHCGERLALRRTRPSQVQRGIKRSRRDGVAIRRGDQERDLTEIFYDLHLHTRRRHGTPVQPRRSFELLWRRILEPRHGFLSLAYSGRVPVAGAVFLSGRETLTFKYSASRPEFWRVRPNHAVIWHAMEGLRIVRTLTRPDSLSEPRASRFQAAVGSTRGGSPPLDRGGQSLPEPFALRAGRTRARSRRPARAALAVPRHGRTPLQACRLTQPPPHGTIRRARGHPRAAQRGCRGHRRTTRRFSTSYRAFRCLARRSF